MDYDPKRKKKCICGQPAAYNRENYCSLECAQIAELKQRNPERYNERLNKKITDRRIFEKFLYGRG